MTLSYHSTRENVRNERACQSMSTSAQSSLVGQHDAAFRENTGVISEQKTPGSLTCILITFPTMLWAECWETEWNEGVQMPEEVR